MFNICLAEIRQLQQQQSIIFIILLVLFGLFVLIHGIHLIRWLRKKDYLSWGGGCLQRMTNKKKENLDSKMSAEQFTHANPNTQSPRTRPRLQQTSQQQEPQPQTTNNLYGGGDTKSGVYSISGDSIRVYTY